MNPKVSIIMGVYNCESTVKESIDSIINQTFNDWEFIICDDGSTDKTYRLVEEYVNRYKNKIILIKNTNNKGLAYSLNRCFKIAKGEYIARQDGDDLSLINRLEEEVKFLDTNEECVLVSTGIKLFDENNIWNGFMPKEYPDNIDVINCRAFVHASAMIRKNILQEVNGYRVSKETLRNEDFDLWSRIYSLNLKGANILKRLYYVREDLNAYKRRKFKYRIDEFKLRKKYFKVLNISLKYYPIIFKPIIIGLIPRRVLLIIKRCMNIELI